MSEMRFQAERQKKKDVDIEKLNTHGRAFLRNFLRYLTASVSEEWYSRQIPTWPRVGLSDSCVEPAGDGCLGGDEAGVRNNGTLVIISRKESS